LPVGFEAVGINLIFGQPPNKLVMSEICKNCKSEITLNFCGNCGQKRAKRIDSKYIKDELQYVLVHTNKGFFYTLKKLSRNPGKTALEFIDGNRVNHYKPLLMVVLLAGVSAFITNTFIHPLEIHRQFNETHGIKNPIDVNSMTAWILKYQSLFMLAMVPITAFFTWVSFKKWGYNYYENVVACAFLTSATLLFGILITQPIQFLLRGNVDLFVLIPTIIAYLSWIVVTIWFFIGLYPDKNAGPVILRVFLFFFLMIAVFVAISIVGGIVYALSNPDLFKPAQ